MFESNMMSNIAQQSSLKAIQGNTANTWRKLVTRDFKEYLDSISTKQETMEEIQE